MASCHKIAAVFLLCLTASVCCLKPPPTIVSESKNVTRKDPNFYMMTICPGNFTSCLRRCPYNISRPGRCLACSCPGMRMPNPMAMNPMNNSKQEFDDEFSNPNSTHPIQAGGLTFHLGKYDVTWWKKMFGGVDYYPGEMYPFVLYNITKNKDGNDTTTTMSDITELLRKANMTDRPVILPVAIMDFNGDSKSGQNSDNSPGMFKMVSGLMHLPFKLNVTKMYDLPVVGFPMCTIHQSIKKSSNAEGITRLISFLFTNIDIQMKLNSVLQAMNPGVPMGTSGFSCVKLEDKEQSALEILKRYSYGNRSFSILMTHLGQLGNKLQANQSNNTFDNMNIADRFRHIIMKLQNINPNYDDKNKANMVKSILLTDHMLVMKFFNLVRPLLVNVTHRALKDFLQDVMRFYKDATIPGQVPGVAKDKVTEQFLSLISNFSYSKTPNSGFTIIIQQLQSFSLSDKKKQEALSTFIHLIEKLNNTDFENDKDLKLKLAMSLLANHTDFEMQVMSFKKIGKEIESIKMFETIQKLHSGLMKIIEMIKKGKDVKDNKTKRVLMVIEKLSMIKNGTREIDRILNYLNQSLRKIPNDHQLNFRKFQKLIEKLKGIKQSGKNETTWMKLQELVLNRTAFDVVILDFNNSSFQHLRWNDTDYLLVHSFLYDVLTIVTSGSDSYHIPKHNVTNPTYTQTITNVECYDKMLAEYSKGIKMEKLIGKVIASLCHGADNETHWDFYTEQGINYTMKFIKKFANKTGNNQTLDDMLELANMTMANETKPPGLKMLFGIIKNFSKISKIRNFMTQKNEVAKFWKHSHMFDSNLLYYLQTRYKYRRLVPFVQDYSGLISHFQGHTITTEKELCLKLKNLLNATVTDPNITFVDAVSEYLRNQFGYFKNQTNPHMENVTAHQTEYDKSAISQFLYRNGISIGNKSLSEFAQLVNGIAKGMSERISPYHDFVANLTKLVKWLPHKDPSEVTECLKKFNTLTKYPEGPMQWNNDKALDKNITPNKCLKTIFGSLSNSDSPFESVKRLLGQYYPGSAVPSKPKEDSTVTIPIYNKDTVTYMRRDCTGYNVPGLIVSRPIGEKSSATHGIPIYFKTLNRKREFEMKQATGPNVFWGLLWINAGPKFNASKFLKHVATLKNNITGSEEGDKNVTKPEFPKKVFPFKLGDNITEIFVVPDPKNNGTIEIKSVFDKKVKSIVIMKKIGEWIVNDQARESERKKREVGTKGEKISDAEQTEKELKREIRDEGKLRDLRDATNDKDSDNKKDISNLKDGEKQILDGSKKPGTDGVAEDSCTQLLPPGWRCLKDEDTISSDAKLRLVHSEGSFAVGILTLAPAGQNESQADPIAKNLVALAPPTKFSSLFRPYVVFGFKKDLFGKSVEDNKEITFKVRDMLKIVDVPGLQSFDKLKEFGKSSPAVQNFSAEILKRVKLPDITVLISRDVLLKDLIVNYRMSEKETWKIVTPKPVLTFNAGVELSIAAKKGHSGGKKDIILSLNKGYMTLVQVKLQYVLRKLSMEIPRGFHLPPVPFDIQDNQGFTVQKITQNLYSQGMNDGGLIGLAVMTKPTSKIGKWEYKCGVCSGWKTLENVFKTTKEMTKRSLPETTGKIRRVRQTGKKCSYSAATTTTVVFLGPATRLRFHPDKATYFWGETEAWSDVVIGLAIFRIQPNDLEIAFNKTSQDFRSEAEESFNTDGAMSVVGTYKVDPNCRETDKSEESNTQKDDKWSYVVDFTKLLSQEKEKFVLERLGCDGRKSSMKNKTDICGVCGGDGKSCIDCNGTLNGSASIDVCGKCVGGGTELNPSKLDCAMSCDNTSYVDECNFCQQKDKKKNVVKDCLGQCFGRARLDKCGGCRLKGVLVGNMTTGKYLMDECGICGGDNSTCSGCDGVPKSGKVLDRCNQCKSPKDATFNKGCGRVYFVDGTNPPSLVIPKPDSDLIKFMIFGYFDTFGKANCSLKMNDDVVDLGKNDVMRSKILMKGSDKTVQYIPVTGRKNILLPNPKTFAQWDITCTSEDNDGSANSTSKSKLLVRTLDPWTIRQVSPKYFPVGTGGDVTITGDGFPADVDLVCATAHYVFGAQSKTALLFKVPTIYKVKAKYVDNTNVNCTFPAISLPAAIKVYVLPEREVDLLNERSFSRAVSGGVVFEYRETSPSVLVARLSDDLFYIVVKFNKAISFVAWKRSLKEEDFCDLILETGSEILGSKPKCRISGSNKLLISPGKGARPASQVTDINSDFSIGNITLKAGSIVARSSNGASQPFSRTIVIVKQPMKPISPLIRLKGTYSIEPCEIANMYFFVSEGVDPWPHKFIWDVDVSEKGIINTKQAIINHLKDVIENKGMNKIQFKNFQPGGNYSITVTIENFLGSRSNKTLKIKAKSHNSALRIRLELTKLVLSSSSSFKLRARSSFLKPKCLNEVDADNKTLSAASVSTLRLKFIWEAMSSDGGAIELADNDLPTLKIAKQTLKPGKYTFTITAIYFESGVEQGRASASAEVEIVSGSIVARIAGPQARVVMSDDVMALDGSRSFDPDGETLTFKWLCEEVDSGSACVVNKDSQNGNVTIQTVERADVAFIRYQTADGKLDFPAKLFNPGTIIRVTLTIRAGSRTSTDSAVVAIKDASNNLPQIAIRPLKFEENGGFFPSNNILRIKSVIFGNTKPWTMIMSWTSVEEDGFAYVDLETVSLTEVKATRNITGPKGIRFPLVIKKNSLEPGSTYKFQLQARPDPEIHPLEEGKDEAELTVYAEITVTTLAVPTGGDFKVSPNNGSALTTEFTLQVFDWSGGSENKLLYYRFAYKSREDEQNDKSNRGLTFLGSFSEQPEIVTRLPPGKETLGYALQVVAFIRIGDDEDTVRMVASDVIVKPVSNDVTGKPSIDEEVIQDIVNEAAEALVSGDRDATISAAILVSKSVGADNKEKRKQVRDLVDEAMKTMKTFKPSSESDAGDALDSVADVLSEFTGEISTSTEAKEAALELVKNILKDLFNYDSSSSSRRRRATDQSNQETISVSLAERMLVVYDKLFASKDELPADTKTSFEDDTEFIMKSFCQAIAYEEPAQEAKSDYFLVGGKKVTLPQGNTYGSDAIEFSLNSNVQNQFSSWDCDTSANITCPGACMSYGVYQKDAIPSQVDSSDSNSTRISPIAGFFVRNPSDGSDSTSVANITGIDDVITIQFKNLGAVINNDDAVIQCRHLEFFLWTNESCSVQNKTSTSVTCVCKKLSGYFGVFDITGVTTTTSPMTTEVSTTEVPTTEVPTTSEGTTTSSNSPSSSTTAPPIAILCKSPTVLADTCTSSCLDWCHKEGSPCSETCVPKKSCVCPGGKHKKNGHCVDEEKDCEEGGKNPGDGGDKEPATMGTAAIVGLTIAIVAVSACLAVAVYMLHKKSTTGRVTPTNSVVDMANRPRQKYTETTFADSEDNKALFSGETEGTSSGVENKGYDAEQLQDPPPYSEKEEMTQQTSDTKES